MHEVSQCKWGHRDTLTFFFFLSLFIVLTELLCFLWFMWSQRTTDVSSSAGLNFTLWLLITPLVLRSGFWPNDPGSVIEWFTRFVFVPAAAPASFDRWNRRSSFHCINLPGIFQIIQDLIATGICHYYLTLFTFFSFSTPPSPTHSPVLILTVIVGTFSLSLRGSALTVLWWVYEQWHL